MLFRFFSRKQRTQPDDDQLQAQSTSNDNDSAILPPPPSHSPSPSSCPPPSPPPPVTDPSALYSLIRSVPPQTFHTYSLDRLGPKQDPPSSPTVLAALSSFFSSLVPPPRLHCVRCHKSYFEVENTDRSCLVPHDDDSAEVERVPLSTGKAKGLASEYETHWGCCGRTVEGDGDMGPPDGWCYEGKHTADIKRARFRADSTPNDDKLVPCSRLRCPGQLLSPSPSSAPSHTGRAARKRPRPVVEDETEAEDPMSQTDVEKDRHSPKRRRTKSTTSRRKSGGSASAADEEKKPGAMDVDPSTPRPKPKRIRKIRKSAAFIEDENDSAPVASTSHHPRSSSPPAQQEPTALLNPKSSTLSSPPQDVIPTTTTAKTKTVSILESQLNNSVGSLSELSSIKSSSPGCGTKVVQRVAYVEVTKPAKRPLRAEETMIVDTDKEVEMGDGEHDKATDKETDGEDKEDQGKGKDKEKEAKHAETPKINILVKARSSPRRPFKLRKSDLGTTSTTIKTPRSRTRTKPKPLSEVVETSVDAEKMGLM